MIIVKSLNKKFGKNRVLIDLDLQIEKPGIYAILGPNGSGKTTLIKSILGMVLPNSGTIDVLGERIGKNAKYRHNIQYMPQIANFPGNLTVSELIRMIKDLRGTTCLEQPLIDTFGLEPFMKKKLSTLSGGTKQKVNIVLAFMTDGQLVILDEPTTGLDPAAMIKLKALILAEKAKGKTMLITSHIMQFVEEMADEIVYILEGCIYYKGTAAGLKEKTGEQNFEHAIAAITQNKINA